MRWDILRNIILNYDVRILAEVGVQSGDTTCRLLSSVPSIELYYAIDPWFFYDGFEKSIFEIHDGYRPLIEVNQQGMDKNYNEFIKRISTFKNEIRNKIKIIKEMSVDARNHIEDGELDLCFIDANHSYEFVRSDIDCWLPKIKKGGILAGHDYGLPGAGINKAVDECFNRDELFTGDDMTWWVKV